MVLSVCENQILADRSSCSAKVGGSVQEVAMDEL